MADVHVRQASLDDTEAICELARSRISAWQRIDDTGQVQDVSYEDLSIYERWLHGGPWMSVETGAIQLSQMLLGAGIPVVALDDGQVVAYAQAYFGQEPAPYGRHLHLAGITVYEGYAQGEADDALLNHLLEQAAAAGCARLTTNCAANDAPTAAFYTRHGLSIIDEVRRMRLSARTGQVFYKATPHENPDPNQIDGWYFSIGRLGNAHYQWTALMPHIWDAIPEIQQRRTHRLGMNAAGNDAFVIVRQQLYNPRSADVAVWTPKPPSGQLVTAIRDWAHREGYRTLVMPTVKDMVKVLGLEAEPDGYQEDIYAIQLS